MTYPITPTDNIVGPITTQLSFILSQQISGLGTIYNKPPQGPPEDNSVVLPLTRFKLEYDTTGKVYVRLFFSIRYIIRRVSLPDDIQRLYSMFSAFTSVLSSWPNQNLNSTAISVRPTGGQMTQFVMAGTPFMALQLDTEVLTEYNILTS